MTGQLGEEQARPGSSFVLPGRRNEVARKQKIGGM